VSAAACIQLVLHVATDAQQFELPCGRPLLPTVLADVQFSFTFLCEGGNMHHPCEDAEAEGCNL